jgi:hypothetical protein
MKLRRVLILYENCYLLRTRALLSQESDWRSEPEARGCSSHDPEDLLYRRDYRRPGRVAARPKSR